MHRGAVGRRRPGRASCATGAAARAATRSRSRQYVNDRPYAASSFLCGRDREDVRHRDVGSEQGTPRARRRRRLPFDVASPGRAVPRRRERAATALRAARLRGRRRRRSRSIRTFPIWGDSRYLDVTLSGDGAAADAARTPLRAAARARRRQALLGGRRRGRQAAAAWRRLARRPSRARAHHPALPPPRPPPDRATRWRA